MVTRPRSLYVTGGAATGKSTFLHSVIDRLGLHYGPLVDLHARPNDKPHGNTGKVVTTTLRGHHLVSDDAELVGVYLGVRRDFFPGSDGLARSSSPAGDEWLHRYPLPSIIVSEGQTLGTRRFLTALHTTTDLLLVHLVAPFHVQQARSAARGHPQSDSLLKRTVTVHDNVLADLDPLGVRVAELDTTDDQAYQETLTLSTEWLAWSLVTV